MILRVQNTRINRNLIKIRFEIRIEDGNFGDFFIGLFFFLKEGNLSNLICKDYDKKNRI